MTSYVLDASAVLAVLYDEPGADRVREALLQGGSISAINLSEVVAKLSDELPPEDLTAAIEGLGAEAIVFDEELAYAAGLLRPVTSPWGLSLGDRACLALASRLGVPAMTTDRAWAGVPVGTEVVTVR